MAELSMRHTLRKVYHTDYSVIHLNESEYSLIDLIYRTLCQKEIGTAIYIGLHGTPFHIYLAPIPNDTHPWSSICYVTEKESELLSCLSGRAHLLDILDFEQDEDLKNVLTESMKSPRFISMVNWDQFMDGIYQSDTSRFSHALSIINDDFNHRKRKLPMSDISTDNNSCKADNAMQKDELGDIALLERPTYQNLIDYHHE